jgi:hypothetical protein
MYPSFFQSRAQATVHSKGKENTLFTPTEYVQPLFRNIIPKSYKQIWNLIRYGDLCPNSKSAKDHQRAQGGKRGGPQSVDDRIADMCKRDFSNPQAVQGRLTIV